jgi:hypothetical protein
MSILTDPSPARENGRGHLVGQRWFTIVAVLGFLLVTAMSVVRLHHTMNEPGLLDSTRWALVDFRDAVYYPVTFFREGGNPYNTDEYLSSVPAGTPFPPYSPLTLLIHLPFGWLPHTASQLTYFGLTIVLTLLVAYLTLRVCGHSAQAGPVFALATLVLVSRPGHWNLMLGQTTLELVIAAYLALALARRSPVVSGLALAWSTFKPPFGVPLAILMVAYRSGRALRVGVIAAMVATLLPVAALVHSSGGMTSLIDSLIDSYHALETLDPSSAVTSPHRIDAFSLISRWWGSAPGPAFEAIVFLVLIAVASAAIVNVRRKAAGHDVDLFCLSVACLAILTSAYQLSYNLLLLVLPLALVVFDRWAPRTGDLGRRVRWVLIAVLSIPFVNVFDAPRFVGRFEPQSLPWLALTSINGLSVLLAFLVYVGLAFRLTWTSPGVDPEGPEDVRLGHPETAP